MPKSRNRQRSKRRLTRGDSLALDRLFDRVAEAPHSGAPPVLYHYTTFQGVQGIISSQRFWETAHDCTNDEAELVSADAVIIEVAEKLRSTATGAAGRVLRRFVKGYSALQVTKMLTVCLSCFSLARDDEMQWKKYGDDGRGVCLGIRVMNEAGPAEPASALVKVDYAESSWREDLTKHFGEVCSALSRFPSTPNNCDLGVAALHRIAAFASIGAKQAEWAVEQEFRHVTLIRRNTRNQLEERIADGKVKRYLPVPVRTEGKRVAFSEIIIGPNQNTETAREKLLDALAAQGYRTGDIEFPAITGSAIPRWNP